MAVLQSEEDKAYITANQAYVKSGSKKSFADWLAEAKASGLIEEGKSILASLFTKNDKEAKSGGSEKTPPVGSDKIMGMPKYVFFGVTAVVVIGLGVIIYKQVKKK